jgi:DNA-binding MarR family transcriptional regulator
VTTVDGLAAQLQTLASYLMRTATLHVFTTIAELDLSFTQIKVLCALDAERTDSSVKGLADALRVSLPAMSRAVDGLFDRELVSRDEDPSDRRAKRVGLTEAGRAVPEALNAARLSMMQELVDSLAADEAEALGNGLALLLERHPEVAAYAPNKEATRS